MWAKPKHLFDYIVERFKDKVPRDTFNSIGENDHLLTDKSEKIYHRKPDYLSFSVNDFGTAHELRYRQEWIARYNMAVAIQEMNHQEFRKNGDKIWNLFIYMIENRKAEIIQMAIQGKLVHGKLVHEGFATISSEEKTSYVKTKLFDKWYSEYTWGCYKVGNRNCNKAEYKCNLTGKSPTVVLEVSPSTAEDLAFLAGITVEELPEQLRHWTKERCYVGNSILSNIDPFDWVIKDEYDDLNFNMCFFLSKQAYNNLREGAGLPKDEFWKTENPSCYHVPSHVSDDSGCHGKVVNRYGIGDAHFAKKCEKCKFFFKNKSED